MVLRNRFPRVCCVVWIATLTTLTSANFNGGPSVFARALFNVGIGYCSGRTGCVSTRGSGRQPRGSPGADLHRWCQRAAPGSAAAELGHQPKLASQRVLAIVLERRQAARVETGREHRDREAASRSRYGDHDRGAGPCPVAVQAVFAKNALPLPSPGRAPWAPTRVRKTFSTQDLAPRR